MSRRQTHSAGPNLKRDSHSALNGICAAMIAIAIAMALPWPIFHHSPSPNPYERQTHTIECVS